MLGRHAAVHIARCFLPLPFLAMAVVVWAVEPSRIAQSIPDHVTVDMDLPRWSWSTFIQIITIIAGVFGVLYQIRRQHQNQMKLQMESYREQLRLQVYREITTAVTEASRRVLDVHMYAFALPASMRGLHDAIRRGFRASPVRQRADEFMTKHGRAETSIHELVNLVGTYTVTVPRLDIFSLALEAATHDLREAFGNLHSLLLDLLPLDIRTANGGSQVVNVKDPTPEQTRDLDRLASAYTSAALNLTGYLTDLKIELQNKLVGRLFGTNVAKRLPLDPGVKVITTDAADYDHLKKYFLEETEWGKTWRETRRRVGEST